MLALRLSSDLDHRDADAGRRDGIQSLRRRAACAASRRRAEARCEYDKPAFRKPGDAATLPELIRFLIDRTGYIRSLEEEGTPEAFSRIENLKELANAAQDAQERGETLSEFLDHAALVSDTDQYNPESRVTLMTLHAAKGLEFPAGAAGGNGRRPLPPLAHPQSNPTRLEEERRLCYVGMTRAMDTLVLTRARYRRRYGNDMPEASIPSRFLEEIPPHLTRGPDRRGPARLDRRRLRHAIRVKLGSQGDEWESPHALQLRGRGPERLRTVLGTARQLPPGSQAGPGSLGQHRAVLLARASAEPERGRSWTFPRPPAATGLRSGQRVRHPKYGEGVVFRREGDGEDAKITVQFAKFGVKKLVEKFAQLERL